VLLITQNDAFSVSGQYVKDRTHPKIIDRISDIHHYKFDIVRANVPE